jgi:phosphate transport system substrate-binding protein
LIGNLYQWSPIARKQPQARGESMIHRKGICLVLTLAGIMIAAPVLAGNIVIKGSTTVLPIAQKVAEAYMKENPDTNISISGGGSGNGIKAIIDGTTDIADSSRFIKDKEVALAVQNSVYPVPFAVAYDCIVPIVHPSNKVTNLTLDQLKGIYKGEIKNWKEVGGPDKQVVVVSRDTSSGTYEVWEEKVMKKERVYPGALLQASNGAVAQTVAKNKNAIGYIGLGYLDNNVKALSTNSIVGSAATTLNGTYPISRPLYMFTNKWPKEDIAKFLNYVMHPDKGQKMVKEIGFVPLY